MWTYLIPLGYVIGGVITARAILAAHVKPDGTYPYDDKHEGSALLGAIFWPSALLAFIIVGIYVMVIEPVITPKAERERHRREALAEKIKLQTEIDRMKAETARLIEVNARKAAQLNGLPYPSVPSVDIPVRINPFRDGLHMDES